MAEICLRASEGTRLAAEQLLERLGWTIREKAGVCLLERGQPCPSDGIVVLFSPEDWDGLETLLGAAGNAGLAGSGARTSLDAGFITGKRKSSFAVLPIRQVRCFRADGDDVSAELPGGSFEVERRLYEIESAYRAQGFIRIAKSLIVNVFWISEILPWFGGRLLLKMKEDAPRLEVSRGYVRDFKIFLGMGGTR
jgi:two-component system, LytTR family, response regulator